ncbi:MAG: Uma2 family endonuclease, partial [Halothece sp.]
MAMPISIPKGFKITPEQFEQLAAIDQLSRLELTETGELIVMSPTGGEAGAKNFNLYIDLGIWNRQTRLGKAFDSSTQNQSESHRFETDGRG